MSIWRFAVPTSLLLCVLGNFHKKKGTFYKKIPFLGGDGKRDVANITSAGMKKIRMVGCLSLLPILLYSENL